MRERWYCKKFLILVVVAIVFALMISSCELSQTASQPSTPTMGLEVPIVSAETKPVDETEGEMEVETEPEADTEAKDTEEEVSEEEEPTPAPTETPMPLPTATEKPVESKDAEEENEEVADVETTATAIPYIKTENNDPMILVYSETSCYEYPDLESDIVGVAAGGSALEAFERDWNWYKVIHPTIGGLTCWISGENIQPNQTAFHLSD